MVWFMLELTAGNINFTNTVQQSWSAGNILELSVCLVQTLYDVFYDPGHKQHMTS